MNRLRSAGCLVLAGLLACVAARGAQPHQTQDAAGKRVPLPRQILIIRHAEKTGGKQDVHLSARGKERAQALAHLFIASADRPDPFPTADIIFAAAHHADSQRPVETVTPLAQKLKLTIDDRYDSKRPAALSRPDDSNPGKKNTPARPGMLELCKEILGSPKYAGKTLLISWRHKSIPELARALKATGVPEKWDDKTYDRVWQIRYADDGTVTFRDRPQRLLPGDSEK